MKAVSLKMLSKLKWFIVREGTILEQMQKLTASITFVLSRNMYFFSSSALQEEGIWYYRRAICCATNPGMPWYLQRSLSCSVSLFSFSDYGPGVIKQQQRTRKAPLILEDLNLNGERFFVCSISNILTFCILWLRNKIKHSQKQTQSCLWKKPNKLT